MLSKEEKIQELMQILNNVDFHIEGIMQGFKKGVGDQDLLDKFTFKKEVLQKELDKLK
jgi:hypothetical protein